MWRIDIGSSVSPENESGNTLGFAGVDAGRGAPGFFLGFAAVGSPEALSKMAPRSLILGEDSTPVSTRTCARAGTATCAAARKRSEEHTSELQSQSNLVCRLLLEKKKKKKKKEKSRK